MITDTLTAFDARTKPAGLSTTPARVNEPVTSEPTGPIRCAVIGSQPTADHGWLRLSLDEYTREGIYNPRSTVPRAEIEPELDELRRRSLQLQADAGLDIVSEGELFRTGSEGVSSSYIVYIAQFIDGIRRTAEHKTDPTHAALAIEAPMRDIDTRVICDDWTRAQQLTDRPVKVNLPGPVTFAARVPDVHYTSQEERTRDYAQLLGAQLSALEGAGCKWAQIDDPHLTWDHAKYPYGVECLDQALAGLRGDMQVGVHMCQGNPYQFTGTGFSPKEQVYYAGVAGQLAKSRVDAVAVEKPNVPGLPEFGLSAFGDKTVFLGLIDVAAEAVEPASQIADDIIMALKEVPVDKLVITPDCGIKHYPEPLALEKLQTMRAAVDGVNVEIQKILSKNNQTL